MMGVRDAPCRHRQGSAVVAMIVVLIIAELVIITMVVGGARDQDLSIRRMETSHAFYAAEAGINMAIREVTDQIDYDVDGGIGSISDDGNAANDPALGPATFVVTAVNVDGQYTLTSVGDAGEAHRKAVAVVGAQSGNEADGLQLGSRALVSEAGRLVGIGAYVKGPPPKLVRYALYTETAGEPGSLITQTPIIPLTSNTFHWEWLDVPETLISPGNYWLALGVEHQNIHYMYQGGGQMRIKSHDPIASGFSSPWGASSTSLEQQIKIIAVLMRDVIGPVNFDTDSEYQNSNPATNGMFRDLTQPTKINRGYDVNNESLLASLLSGLGINLLGADPSLNFSDAGTVSNAVTLYDTTPASSAPTVFDGSVRLEMDLLITGTGTKFIGLAGLINEIPGAEGLAVVLHEKNGSDQLELHRLPQNGDISGSTRIVQSGNLSITADRWYRLLVALTIIESDLFVHASISSHTTGTDPNSPISPSPLASMSHITTVDDFPGLQTAGQVGVVFDGTTSQVKGSITNFRMLADSMIVPAPSYSGSVVSWSEQP